MLRVIHPPDYLEERRYILDLLLHGFLGLDYCIELGEGHHVTICNAAHPDGKKLLLADGLFQTAWQDWLSPSSLPHQPCSRMEVCTSHWDVALDGSSLPVIYGEPFPGDSYYRQDADTIEIGLDLFGSSFFLLTRYEEVVKPMKDDRGRFPKQASLAFQEDFLERPTVNEYVEFLWACLKQLWPGLERSRHQYQLSLGHDLDVPLLTGGQTWWEVLRGSAGDVWRRHSLSLSAGRIRSMIRGRRGDWDGDIGNTFDFIMDSSEHLGERSTFFFITGHSGGKVDGTYALEDPWIRRLIRRIDQRGHRFALHPSYNTFHDRSQLQDEFNHLWQTLKEEGVRQDEIGGRQHFLRWEAPTTWQLYDDVGLSFDATLTFPDACGFRCGTCYEFPVFNTRTRKPLRLIEKPLIVMDKALLDTYRASDERVLKTILRLKQRCRAFGGTFSLLWHNGWLIQPEEKELYRQVLNS